MQTVTRLAWILLGGTFFVAFCIWSSTPEGDKDSHAMLLFQFLLVALPAGSCLSGAAVYQAFRRGRGRTSAIAVLSSFLAPAIALAVILAR